MFVPLKVICNKFMFPFKSFNKILLFRMLFHLVKPIYFIE